MAARKMDDPEDIFNQRMKQGPWDKHNYFGIEWLNLISPERIFWIWKTNSTVSNPTFRHTYNYGTLKMYPIQITY